MTDYPIEAFSYEDLSSQQLKIVPEFVIGGKQRLSPES